MSSDRATTRIAIEGLGELSVQSNPAIDFTPGDDCALTLRPEKIRLAKNVAPTSDEVHFPGTVHDMLYLGDVTVYIIEVNRDGTPVLIEALLANSAPGRARLLDTGDAVEICWPHDAGHLVR